VHNTRSPLPSLRKKEDFKRTFRGKSAAGSLFVVYAAANDLGFHRLGLSVSKKVGCAVVRNRIKRWVRECCRLLFYEIDDKFHEKIGQTRSDFVGFDFIVIARAPAANLSQGAFALVCSALAQLFGRLKVLTKVHLAKVTKT